jgi:hypothetical protein
VLLWSLVGVASLLAGSVGSDLCDGIRENARFSCPRGVLCTRDGSKVIVADYGNDRLRMIDAATKQVTTIARMDAPQFLVFDSTTPTPESVLYITVHWIGVLRRLNLLTNELDTIILSDDIRLSGIAATPSGWLIAASESSVYAIRPSTGRCVRVDGLSVLEKKCGPWTITVVDSECAAYLFSADNCIHRIALPPECFVAPMTGTDRHHSHCSTD